MESYAEKRLRYVKDALDHEIYWEIILGEWKITKNFAFLFRVGIHFLAELRYFGRYNWNAPGTVGT